MPRSANCCATVISKSAADMQEDSDQDDAERILASGVIDGLVAVVEQ